MLRLPRSVQSVVTEAIALLDDEPSPLERDAIARRARAEIARRCVRAARPWTIAPGGGVFMAVFGLGFPLMESDATGLVQTGITFLAIVCGWGVARLCLDPMARAMQRAALSADYRLMDPFR